MKRFTQFVCMLLVVCTILGINVSAAENPVARESNYFSSRLGYLVKTSTNKFQIWFDVTAAGTMQELGVSEITVQRSSDDSNWSDMTTFYKSAYTQMTTKNAYEYQNYVTYTGTSGYYYRAKIWFYAKNSTGTGEYSYTTGSIKL